MTAFLATYTTRAGRRRQLTLEADTPGHARRDLRRRGILPDSLVRQEGRRLAAAGARQSQGGWREWFEAGITVRDKAIFANKLAALVDAGVPILRSLTLMQRQQTKSRFRRALGGIVADVTQGVGLAASMRRWPKVFDNLSIAMVEAGEAGGVLDDTLKRLAKLLEDNAKLRNQVRGAMVYPVLVLIVATLVFLGMTLFIVPVFADIYSQFDAELPWFTRQMLNLSSFLRSSASLFLLGIIATSVYLVYRYYRTPKGRRVIDTFLLRLPVFGDLIQKISTAQFCRTLSSLSRAGVPILQAMDLLGETTSNRVFSDAVVASKADISEGVPLSVSLGTKRVFPEMAMGMLAVGEETGEMDAMLSKVADFYEDEISVAVKSLTSLLEPLLLVVVGGMVGVILVSMYLPMYSVFQHIK